MYLLRALWKQHCWYNQSKELQTLSNMESSEQIYKYLLFIKADTKKKTADWITKNPKRKNQIFKNKNFAIMETYKSSVRKTSLKMEKSEFKTALIRTSTDCADYIRQFYSDDIEIYESMFLLL